MRHQMADIGLKGEAPRRKRRTTNSGHGFPRYPNLVLGFQVERPEQVWVSDITYIRLQSEFVCLRRGGGDGYLHSLDPWLANLPERCTWS